MYPSIIETWNCCRKFTHPRLCQLILCAAKIKAAGRDVSSGGHIFRSIIETQHELYGRQFTHVSLTKLKA